MTTLTVTPQPGTASVLLEVAGAPAGALTITRSDTNGAGPVRLLEGQTPSAGVLIVTDYEPALSGLLTYTLVDSIGAVVTQSTALVGVTRPWLGVPVLPQLGRQVPFLMDDYGADQDSRGAVHEVIGRIDAVPTLGPLGSRRGSLSVFAPDHAEARSIAAVYSRGQVVHLRQTQPGLDMYHVATGVGSRPEQHTAGGWRWRVTITYREVARPTGPLLGGLGWDYTQLAGDFADYASARASFLDYADLKVGP